LKRLLIASTKGDPTISHNLFKHLSNVEFISLELFSIETFEPGTFAHLTNLKTLRLDYNGFVRWSPRLDEFPSLVNLSLSHNEIKYLPSRAFFGLSALVNLDLSCNRIETIENGAFDGLEN
jgi:Leucine-rich repeat (LRR) protein